MSPSKSSEFVVRDRAGVLALKSTVRQEIVDAVSSLGPSSIADVAAALGRSPDGLYFHVRRLVASGLLAEQPARRTSRRTAAVYDVPGRPVRIDPAVSAEAITGVMRGVFSLTRRDLSRAFADGAPASGPLREISAGRVRGWLGDVELARANQLIGELKRLFRADRPAHGARAMALTWALVPCRTGRRRRIRKGAP